MIVLVCSMWFTDPSWKETGMFLDRSGLFLPLKAGWKYQQLGVPHSPAMSQVRDVVVPLRSQHQGGHGSKGEPLGSSPQSLCVMSQVTQPSSLGPHPLIFWVSNYTEETDRYPWSTKIRWSLPQTCGLCRSLIPLSCPLYFRLFPGPQQ